MRVTAGEFELDAQRTPTGTLLRQVWQSRGLIGILARKDFYVRYRRASLGMLWAVGLPLIQVAVLATVFSFLRQGDGPGGNFAAYVITGFMAWTFFSTVVSNGSTALVDGSSLSSRIYFPRLVLPLVHLMTNLHSFVVTATIMTAISILLRGQVEPTLPLLVPALLLMVAMATALCVTLSAIHVYFRDIRYLVTAAMQPWFFLTPVIWSADQLPDTVASILRYNPAVGFMELTRLAVIGEASEGWLVSLAVTVAFTTVVGIVGLRLHTRYDRLFADRM